MNEKADILFNDRKEFYIKSLLDMFKNKHLIGENVEIAQKSIDSKLSKLNKENYLSIRSEFILEAFNDLESILFLHSYFNSGFMLSRNNLFIYAHKNLSIEEVTALYVDIKPNTINLEFINNNKSELFELPIISEYLHIYNILNNAINNKILEEANTLKTYRNFLSNNGIKCSTIDEALESEGLINDNKSFQLSNESKNDYSKSISNAESQTTRKLNNVLKLVYYMAQDMYGYEEGREKETAQKFESLCGIGKATIEKWLNDAAFIVKDD